MPIICLLGNTGKWLLNISETTRRRRLYLHFPTASRSHFSQLLSSLPLSHPNRWDLQKNQFPLPSGEAQCFTTVSDWWRADAISHPAAFYIASELVAIQCIFMANNNRRCNSYSLWWVNLSAETWGWPTQTAGGQSHVNKLLRLNDWVCGSEGLGPIQQSDLRAVSEMSGIQSQLSVLQETAMLRTSNTAEWLAANILRRLGAICSGRPQRPCHSQSHDCNSKYKQRSMRMLPRGLA